ncbi:hypothetical protein BJY20_001061 [Janibacter cremeus]|uniref:Uncharacterized protein n=1 Tax=Janibacter cremeus TaxID=1285192 RepID=A0A852VP19_9MICO|nr:hypothetical protein [Janibacter cremeus]
MGTTLRVSEWMIVPESVLFPSRLSIAIPNAFVTSAAVGEESISRLLGASRCPRWRSSRSCLRESNAPWGHLLRVNRPIVSGTF